MQNKTMAAMATTTTRKVAGSVLCSGSLLRTITGISAKATAEIRRRARRKTTALATAATAVLLCPAAMVASASAPRNPMPMIR